VKQITVMDKFQITIESNCRNAKVTITASSDSIKKREINCQVSTKSGHHSVDLVYKSQSFTDFESVIKFANTIVKANEGKRFWLFVVEKLQDRQKELREQVENTYEFFEYQAQEVCKDETFGSYYIKNKSRFYDGSRCIFQSNLITNWIIQILSGITK
jgi:hypothetical protein